MTGVRILGAAGHRIDEIYRYTCEVWGEAQAEAYIRGLFDPFDDIACRRVSWRPVPAEFGVDGYVCGYEKHFIYWRLLSDGDIGIVTILHERMHRTARFRDDVLD